MISAALQTFCTLRLTHARALTGFSVFPSADIRMSKSAEMEKTGASSPLEGAGETCTCRARQAHVAPQLVCLFTSDRFLTFSSSSYADSERNGPEPNHQVGLLSSTASPSTWGGFKVWDQIQRWRADVVVQRELAGVRVGRHLCCVGAVGRRDCVKCVFAVI